jgi:hypothetical protein
MLISLPIINENKIIYFVFSLILNNDEIIIDNYEYDKNIIETLNFNSGTCFEKINLFLPYKFNIIGNKYLFSCNFLFFSLCDDNNFSFHTILLNEINKKGNTNYTYINSNSVTKKYNRFFIKDFINKEYNNFSDLLFTFYNYCQFKINFYIMNTIHKKKIDKNFTYFKSEKVINHILETEYNCNHIKYAYKYFLNKDNHLEKLLALTFKTINVKNYDLNYNYLKETYYIICEDITIESVSKFIENKNYDENILINLINKFNYPLTFTKKNISSIYEKILYYSLKHINDINNTIFNKFDVKNKFIYNYIIKMFLSFGEKKYKFKYFNNLLLNNILKIIFFEKSFLNNYIKNRYDLNKIKIAYINFNYLVDIFDFININNISKYLSYFHYINENNIYIENIKKNENIDLRILNIINNNFNIFQYINEEKEFIDWTFILKNKLFYIYDNQINISKRDLKKIGIIIYYLSKISNQNYNDLNYIKLLKICIDNPNLVLFNDRINLKIKDYLPFYSLNLGIFAKHIIKEKDNIIKIFEKEIKQENNELFYKKKYYKYKSKYFESKNI